MITAVGFRCNIMKTQNELPFLIAQGSSFCVLKGTHALNVIFLPQLSLDLMDLVSRFAVDNFDFNHIVIFVIIQMF